MSSVLDIAKQINNSWKSKVLTPGSLIPEPERFSMGTLSADYALYGGIPEGKLIVYAGESGSGKSLVSCLTMAMYQRKHPNRTCVYVDAEETLAGQIEWFVKMTGLDISEERFLRYDCSGKSAEEIFHDIIELQKADNIGLIVIDSAPMLLSSADIESDVEKDNGQRASIAKPLGKFLRFMIPMLGKAKNDLIIINHTRVEGKTFTGAKIYSEPCGYSLNFYPTIKVRFATRKFTKGDKLDIAQSQVDDTVDGFCVSFGVTKNRLGALNRTGSHIVFRFESGVDTMSDLIELITKYEIAKRLSTQTWQLVDPITGDPYYDAEGNELKFAGKQKMIDYIRDNTQFKREYELRVSEYINGTNQDFSLIDEKSLKKIISTENAVTSEDEEDEKDLIEGVVEKE